MRAQSEPRRSASIRRRKPENCAGRIHSARKQIRSRGPRRMQSIRWGLPGKSEAEITAHYNRMLKEMKQ